MFKNDLKTTKILWLHIERHHRQTENLMVVTTDCVDKFAISFTKQMEFMSTLYGQSTLCRDWSPHSALQRTIAYHGCTGFP